MGVTAVDITTTWGWGVSFDGTGDCAGDMIKNRDNTTSSKLYLTSIALWCGSGSVGLYDGSAGTAIFPNIGSDSSVDAGSSIAVDLHKTPIEVGDGSCLCVTATDGYFGGFITGYSG
jgi:hypothetical protein